MTTGTLSPFEAATQVRRSHRMLSRGFWVVSLISTILGSALGVAGIGAANGAPQEAAVAAVALLIIIAPYVLARGIDELTRA